MSPLTPDVGPNSSSELGISETSTTTLTETQDTVRAVFTSFHQRPISTHAPMLRTSINLNLYHPRYAVHPPTICVYTS